MLTIKNITSDFNPNNKKHLLENVSISFKDNGIYLLYGENKKVNFLKNVILGLENNYAGKIIYNNVEITKKTKNQFRNKNISHISLINSFNENTTMGDNFKTLSKINGISNYDDQVKQNLLKFNLIKEESSINELLGKKPNEFSQLDIIKLNIVAALIKEPTIIVFDFLSKQLNENDLSEILSTLRKISEEKLIIICSESKEKFIDYSTQNMEIKDNAEYLDSDKNDNVTKCDDSVNYSKNKLSFKDRFNFVTKEKYKHKFGLFASLFLSIISLTFFSCLFTTNTIDKNYSQLKIIKKEQSVVKLHPMYDCITSNGYFEQRKCYLSNEMIEKINNHTDNKAFYGDILFSNHTRKDEHIPFSTDEVLHYDLANPEKMDSNYLIYLAGIKNFFELDTDSKSILIDASIRPYEKLTNKENCRLPNTYTEIAISDVTAEIIKICGLNVYDSNSNIIEKKQFTSIDNIIGEKINDLTITGIYTSDDNPMQYWDKYNVSIEDNNLTLQERQIVSDETCNFLSKNSYVKKGFLKNQKNYTDEEMNYKFSSALISLSNNAAKDNSFLKSLTMIDKNLYKNCKTYVNVDSIYNSIVNSVSERSTIKDILWALSIVLLILSIGLTFLYSYKNINDNKDYIKNLRANGLTIKSLLSMEIIKNAIPFIIIYLLTLIFTGIFSAIFNSIISHPILTLTFLTSIVALSITLFDVILQSLLVVFIVNKKIKN